MLTRLLTYLLLGFVVGLCLLLIDPVPVRAQSEEPAPPTPEVRSQTLTTTVMRYEWWVSRYADNKVLCAMTVEHEWQPTAEEVYYHCSPAIYNELIATTYCDEEEVSQCSGVYLFLAKRYEAEVESAVELPQPEAFISVTGCQPDATSNWCGNVPDLLISGYEPAPNATITAIHGSLDGREFTCNGGACIIPLSETGRQGSFLQFWVDSSLGDSSETFSALLRVVASDVIYPGIGSDVWYVDGLSSQWRNPPPACCSQTWSALPEIGNLPVWLNTPQKPNELRSDEMYYYLAGMLIENGFVDGRGCADGGLQSPGVANQCGVERAHPAVVDWQNRFDSEILRVANDTGVPARLMKGIFSRESQFWPGQLGALQETGLGQLSEDGADMVFLWNPQFYTDFCLSIFSPVTCVNGYTFLEEGERETLKAALMQRVDAVCPSCPGGISLERAGFSIEVFAHALLGSCKQTGQVVYNITGEPAGNASTYEDMWRFTLVNYNAGAGCLQEAVTETLNNGEPLDWAHLSNHLDSSCQGAIPYVEDIYRIASSY